MDNKSKNSGFQGHQQNGAEAMLQLYGLGTEEEDARFSSPPHQNKIEPKHEPVRTPKTTITSAKMSHDEEGSKISAWVPMSLNLAVEGKIHNMAVNGVRTNKTNIVRDYLSIFVRGNDVICPSGHRFIVTDPDESVSEYTCPVCRKKATI